MGENNKFRYLKPKQIPLFEEKDDGSLIEYNQEN
jgi:hypothetical protein